MYSQLLWLAALAAVTAAQNSTTAQNSSISLVDLLGATSSLSTLAATVKGVPGLADSLGSASNVTILAPSNDAFEKFMTSPAAAALAANDTSAIQVSSEWQTRRATRTPC